MTSFLDPLDVLLEIRDPKQRAAAFMALGHQAVNREALVLAVEHFRAAAALDPDDRAPQVALRGLGEIGRPEVTRRLRTGSLRRFLRGRRSGS